MEKPEKSAERKIIRLAETNLDGRKKVEVAIRSIKGVGFMFSNAVASACGLRGKILGDLSETEIKKLEEAVMHPEKLNLRAWIFNRRADPVSGENRHLVASQLEFTTKFDINEMKKLKTYRGIRHILGLPVRGQRTRSSFRKGRTVGVSRKKSVQEKK